MLVVVAVAAGLVGAGGATQMAQAATPSPCPGRLLILSAFPAEMDAWLRAVHNFNPRRVKVVDGRAFYFGQLRGNRVIMALTGIGPVNAEATTRAAVTHFRCGSATEISGIVFSGVAGSHEFIGDVTIPDRWTDDGGTSWSTVDPTMMGVARTVAPTVNLERTAPAGDPACACVVDPRAVPVVLMPHKPRIIIGGSGITTDPVFGRAFPCIPGGGDVFGCSPCRVKARMAQNVLGLVAGIRPFADPTLFLKFIASPPPTSSTAIAEDEETGAVGRVARESGVPFIAFRAVSDGKGDPLHTPGFPVSFFVYRQISADNAAAMTLAFLTAWGQRL